MLLVLYRTLKCGCPVHISASVYRDKGKLVILSCELQQPCHRCFHCVIITKTWAARCQWTQCLCECSQTGCSTDRLYSLLKDMSRKPVTRHTHTPHCNRVSKGMWDWACILLYSFWICLIKTMWFMHTHLNTTRSVPFYSVSAGRQKICHHFSLVWLHLCREVWLVVWDSVMLMLLLEGVWWSLFIPEELVFRHFSIHCRIEV